jgi:hypothetical protein
VDRDVKAVALAAQTDVPAAGLEFTAREVERDAESNWAAWTPSNKVSACGALMRVRRPAMTPLVRLSGVESVGRGCSVHH